jgi:geranylgeranyl diphosphate synthase type I
MAIIIGDMICALGNRMLFSSDFKPELVIQALKKLQEIVSLTVIGQSQDVKMGYRMKATEKEVLEMYENKTARYTIEGPLHLGAILGEAKGSLLYSLSAYAIPVGIAFQIQDDILGMFGSEKKLGKPVGSDIEEGKQTILIINAREKADKLQKAILDNLLGKEKPSLKELEIFRKVIVETGALEYSQNMAKRMIDKGKKALENVKINKEAKDFLLGVADYMASREV